MASANSDSSSTSGLAIASLVFGVLTVAVCLLPVVSLLPGALAVLLGIFGLKKIRRGAAEGKGLAIAGLICGVVGMSPTFLMAGALALALLFGTGSVSIESPASAPTDFVAKGFELAGPGGAVANEKTEDSPNVNPRPHNTDATSKTDSRKQP